MGKTLIEICLVSARDLLVGAGFGSSLLKHQWYAVGWIDPEDKYCTTMDASRSDNAFWRTKFVTSLDDDDSAVQALHVEVYSREPIFLTKKLHGSATVSLEEFLAIFKNQSSSRSDFVENGSYQLWRVNSSKPQGFVDVSIRISAERKDFGGVTGDFGGVMLSNNSGYMAGSSQHPFASLNHPNNPNSFSVPPNNHHSPMPYSLTNNASPQMQQPYYPPPQMKQPYYPPPHMKQPYYPPPPMEQPYYPHPQMQEPNYPPPPMQQPCYPSAPMQPPATSSADFKPRSENAVIPSSSSGGAGRGYARTGPGLGAGAAFYGRDYMSGAEPDRKF